MTIPTTGNDTWPDRGCAYERPRDSVAAQGRWQSALDSSIAAGQLALNPTTDPDVYTLDGTCPRCDHDTSQSVEFEVLKGWGPRKRGRVLIFNFDCHCGRKHTGPGGDHQDCGWGGPLAVQITRP